MTDNVYPRWELFLKVLTLVVLAIDGAVGVAQYLHTAARESQKPFLEKQLAFCAEATGAAAAYVLLQTPTHGSGRRISFSSLYWGRSLMRL